jgi:hypothetical protein
MSGSTEEEIQVKSKQTILRREGIRHPSPLESGRIAFKD